MRIPVISVGMSRSWRWTNHVWRRWRRHPGVWRNHAIPGLQRMLIRRSWPHLATTRLWALLGTVLPTRSVVMVVGLRHRCIVAGKRITLIDICSSSRWWCRRSNLKENRRMKKHNTILGTQLLFQKWEGNCTLFLVSFAEDCTEGLMLVDEGVEGEGGWETALEELLEDTALDGADCFSIEGAGVSSFTSGGQFSTTTFTSVSWPINDANVQYDPLCSPNLQW